jgi:NAD(P)-dependent dehydrogenase (short-subunit alcohol dehydrogenase family)
MEGKVCIITGGASGMGRIAARELAKQGATVVINDREIEEGQDAASNIRRTTGNDDVEFVACDMGEFDAVHAFAQHVLTHYRRIDVLINNAGLTDPAYKLNEAGIEQHMAIMHLGHYLLIELLLDRLRKSAPARIIQISSEAHKAGPGIDFADINCEKLWKGRRYSNSGAFQAYHRAKLAMVCAGYELGERLADSGITVNVVSPGYFVGTNVFRHVRGIMKLGVRLMRPFFTDPERAARTYILLATSIDLEGVTGKYWEHGREKQSSPASHDRELRRNLITYTERVLAGYLPDRSAARSRPE